MARVFPSEWYEPFGLVAIGAFAKGTPDQLVACVNCSDSHPDELRQMGQKARRTFEALYTAERNYEALITIYRALVSK